ncbi:MAG: molybdopterin-dependent oxidoreductase, partial [Burkholderiales bacterium]
VGALTSKPFRYSARTWELARRKSISPHDGLGSNLVVQIKQNEVKRVLPLENEAINECWLSDRDRFSYEGLNSSERLARPMVRDGAGWKETDWQTALERVVEGLKRAGSDLGVLASPQATLEELALAARLARGMGGGADFRLRHSDFSADGKRGGVPWLGMPIAELDALDRVLVVGSFLRKEHPLVAHRLRQAAKRGAQCRTFTCADDDLLMPIANRAIVAPSALPAALAGLRDGPIGASLASGKNTAILLGNFAQQHPQAASIHAQAQALAEALGARLGLLGEAANSVGGYLAGLPCGANAREMLARSRKAYLILGAEPELDCADPQAALAALQTADFVVALSPFWHRAADYAQVLLPIAPFTETYDTFVSMEGRVQSFQGALHPLGETRPGWKVLRVLGNLLGLDGFDEESREAVRDACLAEGDVAARLSNRIDLAAQPTAAAPGGGIERIADVPIYFADPLVRRAVSLQRTTDGRAPRAWMNAKLMRRLEITAGTPLRLRQDGGEATLAAALDERLPDDCVRVAAAHSSTAGLGAMFGTLTVEKDTVEKAA